MVIESLLIGLVAIVALLALLPAGRRLLATGLDIVDASVAMFALRRALGLDTTTARQRRIDRRHAREQAELERRIGAVRPAAPPTSSAPSRLVVAGVTATHAAGPAGSFRRRAISRRTLLRDTAVAALGLAIVLAATSLLEDRPTGEVLGATAQPDGPGGVVRASVQPTASAVASNPAEGFASTTPEAPVAEGQGSDGGVGIGPVVGGLQHRLIGGSGGGRTVGVVLSWDLADGSVPAASVEIAVREDDGEFQPVATVAGDTGSLDVSLSVRRTSTFRIRAAGEDGTVGAAREWPPITPAIHQETSRLVTVDGRWRTAGGPSLSGDRVTFSAARSATLTLRFTGSDVGWVATRTPMSGRAEVRLDGAVVKTVDLAADSVRYRRIVFRQQVDADTKHVLEIRPIGDGRVDVDAFIVLR